MKNKIYIFIMLLFFIVPVYAEGEATIKNLKINGVECSCNGYECSIEIDAPSATITYELTDPKAKVDRLSGFKIDLLSKLTTVKVHVENTINDEKVENTYNINISKPEKKANFKLKSLKVNGTSLKIFENSLSYNFECEYDTKIINIEVVTDDPEAKVIKEDQYEIEEGSKSMAIDFFVQASNGEKETYCVVVTKREKPDTTLKNIKLDYGEIDFNEKKTSYELTVPYNINQIKVEAVPKNKDAKVEIKNNDLVVGENEITITVIDGKNKAEYKILVTREENIDKSVANLSSITIDEYPKFSFEENVLDYTLNFSDIPEKLTIKTKSKNPDSDTVILENENLKDGSKIIIKNILKENKITREYILTIKKVETVVSNKKIILVCIIALIITMAVLLFLDIRSRKNEKRRYLKKVMDLRHKIEKLKKDGKIVPIKRKNKVKKKEKNKDKEEDLEII